VLGAFTGSTAGQEGFFKVIQDATGGRTLSLVNAVYDFYGPSIENIVLGANEETLFQYRVISSGSMVLKRWGASSTREGGRDFLAEILASSSATIDFVLTKYLTLYDRFEVDFDEVVSATNNVSLLMRTSTNGGSSYDAGSTDYTWRQFRMRVDPSSTTENVASTGDSALKIMENSLDSGLSNLATKPSSGTVKIYKPNGAGICRLRWEGISNTTDVEDIGWIDVHGAGARVVVADVDAIRFLANTGNLASGSFRLYGVRK
jgi:hypothetical protein